ncbi:MAG: thiamine phosphate synthase [Acidobacteriia bacterium]|nr:thiamine phosphate synthase [Terriglobia bacterium]
MPPSAEPILCYVSDRKSLPADARGGEAALLQALEGAAAAGVDWIQIREKELPGARLAALTRAALERAPRKSRIVVNDRLDVALAAGAGGVHLGEESLPAEEVVRWLRSAACAPRDFLVGVSCHALEAARAAEHAGADYVFFGPVFATPAKAAYGAPQGLPRLGAVCRTLQIPVLAIGGITAENAAACLAAGARGIAAIRLFQDATDISDTVRRLRRAGPRGS